MGIDLYVGSRLAYVLWILVVVVFQLNGGLVVANATNYEDQVGIGLSDASNL